MRFSATIILGERLDVNMTKNSSKHIRFQNLVRIPDRKVKRFLVDYANMSDDGQRAIDAFERRYFDIIPSPWLLSSHKKTVEESAPNSLLRFIDERNLIRFTPSFRDALRAIWIAPDQRTKEWGVFRLIEGAVISQTNPRPDEILGTLKIIDGSVAPLPPPSPLEQCLQYLLRNATKTLICSNQDCPARFFFASRKSQKYCSTDCALPAQRFYKRKWWAKNGKQRRTQRATRS
jgi:hypothetical protein